LTAAQSFGKDLILLALIAFIFIYRKSITPFLRPLICSRILILTSLFSFALQGYVFRHLPIVDCLPYKAGKNIQQQMKVPDGAIADSTVITFVYTKAGKQVEFTSAGFPDDFDDSLYHFVKRYDKLVRKGNAEPAIKDFALTSLSGNDSTKAILSQPGYAIYIFAKDQVNADYDREENKQLRSILDFAKSKATPVYVITNTKDVLNELALATKDSSLSASNAFLCDAVAIKTAARANPTLYLLKDGVIQNKWAYPDLKKAYAQMQKIN
jgi:hypothetical protein